MPKGKTQSRAQTVCWWLDGEEECVHCGQEYAYELEFRCPECDGPTCPHCRTTHSQGHAVCPVCVTSPQDHTHG